MGLNMLLTFINRDMLTFINPPFLMGNPAEKGLDFGQIPLNQ
jgi:hypothetical protein